MRKNCLNAITAGLLTVYPLAAALAQTAPDTGRILREQTPPPSPPAPGGTLRIDPYRGEAVQPGGPKAKLEQITFYGNTAFSSGTLQMVLGSVVGQEFDMAGLQSIADRVGEYYRAQGFPFARAILPPQTVSSGRLKIEIIEGRYGQVIVIGNASLKDGAEKWLAPLKSGDVIREKTLERTTLVLQDQPGVITRPLIRPGERVGTGDLEVKVDPVNQRVFDIGIDNRGSRYTGRNRFRANATFNSPTMLGDQLQLGVLKSDADLTLGNVSYSRPFGYSGLRLLTGLAQTTYMLSPGVAISGTGGKADIANLGLSYPYVRSNAANLSLSANLQHKSLRDFNDSSRSTKTGYSLPLIAQFDVRDSTFGPAITYGTATYTLGNLSYRDSADNTAGTAGSFRKVNFDVVRQQVLPMDMLFSARLSWQIARKNLDSSEDFVLGGPFGVRAYPTGEASGDRGWLTQLEIRKRMGFFTPYVFFDYGRVDVNARAYAGSGTLVSKQRGGAGLGVRIDYQSWAAEAILATPTIGGRPETETSDPAVRAWLNAGYRF